MGVYAPNYPATVTGGKKSSWGFGSVLKGAAEKAAEKAEQVRAQAKEMSAMASERVFTPRGDSAVDLEAAAIKVDEFRQALTALHVANVEAFLGGSDEELYPRPGAAEAATGAAATARRLAPLALEAVKVAGYGKVVLGYKVAKGGVAAMLLTPQARHWCPPPRLSFRRCCAARSV